MNAYCDHGMRFFHADVPFRAFYVYSYFIVFINLLVEAVSSRMVGKWSPVMR